MFIYVRRTVRPNDSVGVLALFAFLVLTFYIVIPVLIIWAIYRYGLRLIKWGVRKWESHKYGPGYSSLPSSSPSSQSVWRGSNQSLLDVLDQ